MRLARQAEQIRADTPGRTGRVSGQLLAEVLTEAGDLATAERIRAAGLARSRDAAQLHISVRTVSSHLDRIRDKTGCRRRADLTRLALSAGLV